MMWSVYLGCYADASILYSDDVPFPAEGGPARNVVLPGFLALIVSTKDPAIYLRAITCERARPFRRRLRRAKGARRSARNDTASTAASRRR
jgi:hypothetical protein